MTQTRLQSGVEAVTQTIIAFGISVVIQPFLYGLYGWEITYAHSAELAAVFTLISLLRSYVVRRVFNCLH